MGQWEKLEDCHFNECEYPEGCFVSLVFFFRCEKKALGSYQQVEAQPCSKKGTTHPENDAGTLMPPKNQRETSVFWEIHLFTLLESVR